MEAVLLVIHLLVAIALIAVVLLQRSEGGALGIGGGGGGGMFSPRGAGNILTKATVALAAVFFLTSITLTIIHRESGGPSSILDDIQSDAQQEESGGQSGGDGSVLPNLPQSSPSQEPQVPVSE
ncbi:preprotein translocase subunit SecG [Kaustia mangrovi]|uniref:Protein-export membrane protein SecG n=1 Tax=Kaustia mangrovi TaxID=2593653 RepID=A0A7S8HAJ2_9HYPH|nr:preprotein translocase subunit SecG [Kaustia mangrovi]QPC41489.1 preprotein translocase subunit SecG [Kaustia mangrovi]